MLGKIISHDNLSRRDIVLYYWVVHCPMQHFLKNNKRIFFKKWMYVLCIYYNMNSSKVFFSRKKNMVELAPLHFLWHFFYSFSYFLNIDNAWKLGKNLILYCIFSDFFVVFSDKKGAKTLYFKRSWTSKCLFLVHFPVLKKFHILYENKSQINKFSPRICCAITWNEFIEYLSRYLKNGSINI